MKYLNAQRYKKIYKKSEAIFLICDTVLSLIYIAIEFDLDVLKVFLVMWCKGEQPFLYKTPLLTSYILLSR